MAKPVIKIVTHSCANKNEAENLKKKWRAELPEVKSTYKPSGKMPAKALWLMIPGTFLGVPAGALAGAATLAVGSIISWLLVKLMIWMEEEIKLIYCLPVVMLFIVVIATYLGMYILAGMAAGGVVTQLGKAGKNRNTSVPMALSAISAMAGVIPFWFISSSVARSLDEGPVQQALQFVFTLEGVGLVLFILGLITAAVSTVLYSRSLVLQAKFCENCEQYMTSSELAPISFENAKELVRHLDSGNIADIPKLIPPKEKGEGKVTLFSCPGCSVGFLEASLSFSAKWVEIDKKGKKEEKNLSEVWLIASRSLSTAEVKLFEALKKA